MTQPDRNKLYTDYFNTIFQESNELTKEQFESACLHFDVNIGKFMPENRDAKILDVGCGCGNYLYYLEKKGYTNYLGIDISAQQIDYCKNNITTRVEVADTFEFLKNKKDVYDFIALNAVLEHIPKDQTVELLILLYNALKKDGILALEIPNMSNIFSMDLRYKDFTHEAGFTEVSLRQVLKIAKFEKIYFTSSKIIGNSFKNKVHRMLVNSIHTCLRFIYYIQGYSVPDQLGKLLIAVAKK